MEKDSPWPCGLLFLRLWLFWNWLVEKEAGGQIQVCNRPCLIVNSVARTEREPGEVGWAERRLTIVRASKPRVC